MLRVCANIYSLIASCRVSKKLVCFLLLSLPHTLGAPIGSSDVTIQSPVAYIYQAAALGGFGIIIAGHRTLLADGFTNSFEPRTDLFTVVVLSLTSGVWSALVVISGLFELGRPCSTDILLCAGRMVYLPHMINATILLWMIYYVSVKFKLSLWTPPPEYSREAWSSAFRWHVVTSVNALLACVILCVSAGAAKAGDYTGASLSIVGLVVYISRAGGTASYDEVNVPFKNHNFLRVLLPTSHKAGTLYMSPPNGVGIHPTWSYVWPNQIEPANTILVPALIQFRSQAFNCGPLLQALRDTATALVRCTQMDDRHFENFINWLLPSNYEPHPEQKLVDRPSMKVARETFYYLFHLEYYLFVNRRRISLDRRRLMCRWRDKTRSGANDIGDQPCYGKQGGTEGLTEALTQVALLFGKTPTLDLLRSKLRKSSLPGYDPAGSENYAGRLWTHCINASETTFGALYIFCDAWVADNGVDKAVVLFDFRAKDEEGDKIMYNIMWRQAWYTAVVAQLIASSAAIAGAVVGGILL